MVLTMTIRNEFLGNPSGLLRAIIGCLNDLLNEGGAGSCSASVFDLKAAPTISIGDYLGRMLRYMNCSVSVFVMAVVLLDRCQEYNSGFLIHRRNIHRLFLVATVVAAKYLEDFYYKNSFYANVGGLPLKALNELELEFLHLINFNCAVEESTFASYIERLELYSELNTRKDNGRNNERLMVSDKENLAGRRTVVKCRAEPPMEEHLTAGQEGI